MKKFEIDGYTYECDETKEPLGDIIIQEDSGDNTPIVRYMVHRELEVMEMFKVYDEKKYYLMGLSTISSLANIMKPIYGYHQVTKHNNPHLPDHTLTES